MNATQTLTTTQLTTCPSCGDTAEIVRRDVLESTDGPIEHVYVRCVGRHWFMLSIDALERHRALVAH
ncbi:hypothetical protein [Euzebya tangerina]|uniref:hypothetical protein n=1 Tax=Euzebya tangerina TaxID=591198 RepID=UPI000E314F92|nr:hypothetical protein [Euzebya tangerina]